MFKGKFALERINFSGRKCVLFSELYEMKTIKPPKILIAILFAGTILISNSLHLYGFETHSTHIVKIDEVDSTKVKTSQLSTHKGTEKKDNVTKSKSTAQSSYNFIYFLITQFMKMNPLSRP